MVIAANDLLRDTQDTRTPLIVVGGDFAVNAVPNELFIYGFG